MNSFSTLFSSLIFFCALVAGAVFAEPPLPKLTFVLNDKEVDSRLMTPKEHTA